MPITPPAPHNAIWPISKLNREVKRILESGLPLCWVSGEISNLVRASSGHIYFSLKDSSASARCVMFKNRAQLVGFRLENGTKIEARAMVTLYEPRGDFQLNIETIRRSGSGDLFEQFLLLKDKLAKKGWFSPEAKKTLPKLPKKIGVITSLQAAALRDICTTLKRRCPQIPVIIYPTAVQGDLAPEQIAKAIQAAVRHSECDVLLLCRGGGSIEDLWSFNTEIVAEAMINCPIPIISGIGHETDFTIADFVAVLRAATPTGAAEQARIANTDLLNNLTRLKQQIERTFQNQTNRKQQQIDLLKLSLKHPRQVIQARQEQCKQLGRALNIQITAKVQQTRIKQQQLLFRFPQPQGAFDSFKTKLTSLNQNFYAHATNQQTKRQNQHEQLRNQLTLLNPMAVLSRGYTLTLNQNGQIITNSQFVEPNENITVCFNHGYITATVNEICGDSTNPIHAPKKN